MANSRKDKERVKSDEKYDPLFLSRIYMEELDVGRIVVCRQMFKDPPNQGYKLHDRAEGSLYRVTP